MIPLGRPVPRAGGEALPSPPPPEAGVSQAGRGSALLAPQRRVR